MKRIICLFVGTLALSLSYCSGDDGNIGPMGPKGEKGIQGEKGDKGDPGKNGKDGKDGKDGKKGDPGKDGKDGADGNANVTISSWKDLTGFRVSGGVGSTRFDKEIYGEKSWQVAGQNVNLTEDDIVMVFVRMIKAPGEVPLVKQTPFEMEVDNYVVNFRYFLYNASTLYFVLGLKEGNVSGYNSFDFEGWANDHEVQWRHIIIKGGQSVHTTQDLPDFKNYQAVQTYFQLID